jgi:hypothetical protein
VEVRTLTSTTFGVETTDGPGLAQFLRLERRVTVAGVTTTTAQHAVTSLCPKQADSALLLALWRFRWAVENRIFRVRDVVFGEDASRIRTGTAPHVMRNAAINLLQDLKVPNITAARREHAVKLDLLLDRLHIVKQS